jgi:HEAT repeat protein
MWAVQALALPPQRQVALFPSFAEAADELALEHEETQPAFLAACGVVLTGVQTRAIKALDDALERMSGEENACTLWTVEALADRPEWNDVRSLADDVLSAMGGPQSAPPLDRGAAYVASPEADP